MFDWGPSGSWDYYSVYHPIVLFDGTEYKMWYCGSDGSKGRISLTTSPDGIRYWNDNRIPTPVLNVGDSGEWDNKTHGDFTVIFDGTEYKMWYNGLGNSVPGFRIGLATVENANPVLDKLGQHVSEFNTYIANNKAFIPNYSDRYRYGEMISTAFVESTVNQVVSKRMVKKQQMRWTRRGAHLLLQVRTQVLNDDWRDNFCRWYPAMTPTEKECSVCCLTSAPRFEMVSCFTKRMTR